MGAGQQLWNSAIPVTDPNPTVPKFDLTGEDADKAQILRDSGWDEPKIANYFLEKGKATLPVPVATGGKGKSLWDAAKPIPKSSIVSNIKSDVNRKAHGVYGTGEALWSSATGMGAFMAAIPETGFNFVRDIVKGKGAYEAGENAKKTVENYAQYFTTEPKTEEGKFVKASIIDPLMKRFVADPSAAVGKGVMNIPDPIWRVLPFGGDPKTKPYVAAVFDAAAQVAIMGGGPKVMKAAIKAAKPYAPIKSSVTSPITVEARLYSQNYLAERAAALRQAREATRGVVIPDTELLPSKIRKTGVRGVIEKPETGVPEMTAEPAGVTIAGESSKAFGGKANPREPDLIGNKEVEAIRAETVEQNAAQTPQGESARALWDRATPIEEPRPVTQAPPAGETAPIQEAQPPIQPQPVSPVIPEAAELPVMGDVPPEIGIGQPSKPPTISSKQPVRDVLDPEIGNVPPEPVLAQPRPELSPQELEAKAKLDAIVGERKADIDARVKAEPSTEAEPVKSPQEVLAKKVELERTIEQEYNKALTENREFMNATIQGDMDLARDISRDVYAEVRARVEGKEAPSPREPQPATPKVTPPGPVENVNPTAVTPILETTGEVKPIVSRTRKAKATTKAEAYVSPEDMEASTVTTPVEIPKGAGRSPFTPFKEWVEAETGKPYSRLTESQSANMAKQYNTARAKYMSEPVETAPTTEPKPRGMTDILDDANKLLADKEGGTTLYSNPLHLIPKALEKYIFTPVADKLSTYIPDRIVEFVKPTSRTPGGKEFRELRGKTAGRIGRIDDLAKTELSRLIEFPEQDQIRMMRAIEPDGGVEISWLPAEQQAVVRHIIKLNDRLGKLLVLNNVLPQEVLDAHKGGYIHYQYLRHMIGEENIPHGPGGKIDMSILKQRSKDMTIAQRRAIGLIENLSIAEPTSILKAGTDWAMAKAFKTIAEDSRMTWQPARVSVNGKSWDIASLAEEIEIQERVVKAQPTPETTGYLTELNNAMAQAKAGGATIPKGFKQMPTGKQWGELSGQWVQRAIRNDLVAPEFRTKSRSTSGQTWNTALDMAETGMTWFKLGKTALNIPTSARNVVSNVVQLNMSGIPLYEVPVYVGQALNGMLKKNSNWVAANRNGLFRTNFSTGELNEVTQLLNQYNPKGRFNITGFAQSLGKYYGKIDDVFKFSKFLEQRSNGVDIATAIDEAQKWGMDYSLASNSIKAARRSIAPFITYQYKIYPLIAESIAKRPWVIAKYLPVPVLMEEMVRGKLNLTEDDWDKLKKDLPSFIQRNRTYTPMPWRSPEGNVQWVNLEYYLPWQQALALMRDIPEGRLGEAMTDLGIGNPYADIYSVLKTMEGSNPPIDPFTHQPIFDKLDGPTEKAVKTSEWLYNKWMPPMVTRQGVAGSLYQAATGEKDRQGRVMTPGRAAAKLGGFNLISPTPEQGEKERMAILRDLQSSLTRITKDPAANEDKITAARDRFRKSVITEVGLTDTTTRILQNMDVEDIAVKALNNPIPENIQELQEYVDKQPEVDQGRLWDRVETVKQFHNIPDRAWWIDLSNIQSPESRAESFYKKLKLSPPDKQQEMLKMVDSMKGIASDRFLDKLEELAGVPEKQ